MQRPAFREVAGPCAAIEELVASRGYALADFEVEEDDSQHLTDLFGLVGGVVMVRRRSNHAERVYAAGPGGTWYAAFLADMDEGFFGEPEPESDADSTYAAEAQSSFLGLL